MEQYCNSVAYGSISHQAKANKDEKNTRDHFNTCNAAAYGVFYGYSCRCGGSNR